MFTDMMACVILLLLVRSVNTKSSFTLIQNKYYVFILLIIDPIGSDLFHLYLCLFTGDTVRKYKQEFHILKLNYVMIFYFTAFFFSYSVTVWEQRGRAVSVRQFGSKPLRWIKAVNWRPIVLGPGPAPA